MTPFKEEIEKLEKERESLKNYIISKTEGNEDWHAVSDAANDLREIDCKLEMYVDLQDLAYQLLEGSDGDEG